MSADEYYTLCARLAALLEAAGFAYEVGGALASILYGVPRTTLDVDVVVQLTPEQAPALCAMLGDDFFYDLDAIHEGITKQRCFNVLDKETGLKVDIFPIRNEPYWRGEFARRRQVALPGGGDVWCTSPEDIVLKKLHWYRQGGEASQRQWDDTLGVLRIFKDALDEAYLDRWAGELNITDLWKKAQQTAT